MRGLLNPANAIETTGSSFKEGLVRVDASLFKVHQNKGVTGKPPPTPICALVWDVTRLDPDNQEPLHDDDGNPQTEEVVFSLGGKSLVGAHPGKADSADDEDAEDQGVDVGAEGQTVFLADREFKLNSKSGLNMLMASLKAAGFKEEYLDRVWAPDFVGSVFHMKTEVSKEMMTGTDGKERPISYKVVDKIVRAGYEKKKGAGAESAKVTPIDSKKGGGATAGAEVEAILKPILEKLSEDLDGQQLTRKALTTRVSGALQSGGVPPKMHVPVLTLVKDNTWLSKNAAKYDITFDAEANTVVFGQLKE